MSLNKVKEISNEIAEAKRKLNDFAKNDGKSAIAAAFAELLEKSKDIKTISWKQLTPYFNDGDPCYFRVRELDVYTHDDNFIYDASELSSKEESEICNQLYDLHDSLDPELLESVFGNDAEITITKDEIKVKAYEDHD